LLSKSEICVPSQIYRFPRLGVTVRLTNRVPRGIREPAVILTPTVSRVEGGFDTAVRAVKECWSHNSTRPMKESRESVPELRGKAQP